MLWWKHTELYCEIIEDVIFKAKNQESMTFLVMDNNILVTFSKNNLR